MINEMFHLDSYGVIVVATAWESPYDDTKRKGGEIFTISPKFHLRTARPSKVVFQLGAASSLHRLPIHLFINFPAYLFPV